MKEGQVIDLKSLPHEAGERRMVGAERLFKWN
jgi:hypothetical protein